MKIKKILSTGLAALLCGAAFSACSPADNDRIQIVTTIFPEYDWAYNVSADSDAEIEVLLDSGVDMHNFQPTASDIVSISTCDLFIYVGGESDDWVESALKNSKNKNRKVINLTEVLSSSLLEVEEIEEDHDHEHEEEETAYDEHVWLSLRNAQKAVNAISKALQELDENNAALYQANAKAYNEKLKSLDETYQKSLAACEKQTLVFGDRFPFLYLCKDYNLSYFAAFSGCSASTSASFTMVTKLAEKLNEFDLNYILTIEGSENRTLAERIIEQSGKPQREILTVNSMQAISAAQISSGVTYLSVMEENLEVFTKALS